MTPTAVVFDIGGVLVDWRPHLAWADELREAGVKAYLDRIGFDRINLACDGGASFADAADAIADPQDAARLSHYVVRYARTVPDKISGSWDILHTLKDGGVPLHAITNWSAETWPAGLKAHPELGEVFDTVVVSGQVGMIKPGVAIYRHLCARAGLPPEACVVIDDGWHNCLGARAAGMDAIHFQGPDHLRSALQARGLL